MATLSIIHLQYSFNKILKLKKKILLTTFSYSFRKQGRVVGYP